MLGKLFASFLLLLPATAPHADSAAPVTPEGFFLSLEEPIAVNDVTTSMALDDGILIVVEYNVGGVGPVSIMLDTDDAGSGCALITVRGVPVVELELQDGAVASEAVDFAALAPSEVQAAAASVVQVWSAVDLGADTTGDSRGKCWLAGFMAGKVAGIFAGGACAVLTNAPPACIAPGKLVDVAVKGYVQEKCNGAQNGS